MHPIYECPENVSAIKQLTIAQESPHYNLITIWPFWRWNYFRSISSNVITAPNSDLGLNLQTDRQTDEHYCGIIALCEASRGKNHSAHVAVKERMGLKLFGREIIFEKFPLCDMIPKRDGWTDDMQSHNCALHSTARFITRLTLSALWTAATVQNAEIVHSTTAMYQ